MIRRGLMSLGAVLLTITVFAASMGTAFANDPFKSDAVDPCKQAPNSALCTGKDNSGKNPLTGPNGIIRKTTLVIATIAGIAAVIMVLVGGFMYVTAGGDAGKVGEAKKTILYAIVGLLVISVSEALILFVLSKL